MKKLNINFLIADIVAQFNLGIRRRYRFIKIAKTQTALRLMYLFYKTGIIRTYIIKDEIILIYFKYHRSRSIITNINVVSKPSKRCYWRLGMLSKNYNKHNFGGYYVVSTPKGLVNSDYCLLLGHCSGEILIKVEL